MRTIRLGRTEAQVPALSLGTWPHGGPGTSGGHDVGWSGNDDAASREALVRAWERGITHWDTADAYGEGHAERLIGSVWDRVPREEIFLASKVGWVPGPYRQYYHPEQVEKQVAASFENLEVEVIDLFYLHHCDFGPEGERLGPALDVLRRYQKEGRIRFIGLSDWDAGEILRYAPRVDPDVVQPYRNLQDDDFHSSGLGAWTEANDVGVAFFSPLKHGLLLGKYTSPPSFPRGDHRRTRDGFFDQNLLDGLRLSRSAVERHLGPGTSSVLRALIQPLLADSPGACALVGLRDPAQVEVAAAAGEALDPDDLEWCRELYRDPAIA